MPDVLPHLMIDPATVSVGPWQLNRGDEEWTVLPSFLPDWDYNTDLVLGRTATLELEQAWEACDLAPGTPITWAVGWRATDSQLSGCAHMSRAKPGNAWLPLDLPAAELGVAVELRTRLVLGTELPPGPAGRPWLPGSILWEDTHKLRLQGQASRFPTDVVGFGVAGLDRDASLCLDVSADVTSPVMGGLLLLLNSNDIELVNAVQKPATTDGRQQLLVSQLFEEVFVRLVLTAVERADELLEAELPSESLGRTLLQICGRAHPLGLRGLAALAKEEPERLRATVVGEARRRGYGRRFE